MSHHQMLVNDTTEQRDQGLEIPAASGGREGIDDLPSAGRIDGRPRARGSMLLLITVINTG
ncbi:hypothetical protein [Nonomuraea sp. KM90]|uniref:hypothetical protein n=1 Tax=Nonomuraea sp. KM90 TaxID=3457428 RepID=UPI003FCC7C15